MQGAAVVEGDIAGTVFDHHSLAVVYNRFESGIDRIVVGGVDVLNDALLVRPGQKVQRAHRFGHMRAIGQDIVQRRARQHSARKARDPLAFGHRPKNPIGGLRDAWQLVRWIDTLDRI